MKKKVSLLLAVIMIMSMLGMSAFAAPDISVTVAGEPVVWTDAAPFIDANSRTLVPLRAVADAMGLEVTWDAEERIASFSYTGTHPVTGVDFVMAIHFPIGESLAATTITPINAAGELETTEVSYIEMDTAAVIVNSRTYAPIRYLAEFFDRSVGWDNDTRTVIIGEPYAYYATCVTFSKDYVNYVFVPMLGYDRLGSLEVTKTYINGDESNFRVFTQSELDALNANYDFLGVDAAFYAVQIRNTAPAPSPEETFAVLLDITETMPDGTVYTFLNSQEYMADEYWGYGVD